MSDFSILLSRVRTNLMQEGVRYLRFTTTSAGNATGTTVVSTALTQLDDYWNNAKCARLDTNEETQVVRTVEDFAKTTGTLTFTSKPFDKKIVSGVDFELSEPGTWGADDIKRFLLEAAPLFLRIAPDDSLKNYFVRQTIGGVLGTTDLPANVIKFVEPILLIDGKKVDILKPERAAYLSEAAYIDPVNGTYIGYFAGRSDSSKNVGQFLYKPATNQDCVWYFVPSPAFDASNNWKIPEELWEPIIFLATKLALTANERIELAQGWDLESLKYIPKQADTE